MRLLDASPQLDQGDACRRALRTAAVIVPLLFLLGLLAPGFRRAAPTEKIGGQAPDFEFPQPTGNGAVTLRQFAGKPLIIDFWASWCVPCRREAPVLRDTARAFAGRIAFLRIGALDGREEAGKFVAEFDLDYARAFDDGGNIKQRYGVTGIPHLLHRRPRTVCRPLHSIPRRRTPASRRRPAPPERRRNLAL